MLLEHKTQAPAQTNLDHSPKYRLAAAIVVVYPGKADLNAPRLMNSRAKSLVDLIDNAAKKLNPERYQLAQIDS